VTVSMAGYNTVAELLANQKRAVVVPRTFPRREQWLRARALEARGLLQLIDPEALTPEALAGAVDARLSGGPPPVSPVDFGGLRRISRRARTLLGLGAET